MRWMVLLVAALAPLGAVHAQDAAAPPPAAPPIMDPLWISSPGDSEHATPPPKAVAKGVNGRATLSCTVGADGLFSACGVLEETPVDFGFGDAAIAYAEKYRMKPKTRGGQPTAGHDYVFPVDFYTDSLHSRGTLILHPVWRAAPSRQAVADAYRGLPAAKPGRAVLRCSVKKIGGALYDCVTVSEIPEGQGYDAALARLTPAFIVNPETMVGMTAPYVEVPVSLYDPATAPADATVDNPKLIRGPTAEAMRKAFPAGAPAGVDHAQVGFDCVADAAGMMTGCKVIAEAPEGAGFGAAALPLATAVGINPWTAEGRPVEGGHARFALPLDRPKH